MSIKSKCHICEKEKVVFNCSGCLQNFCLNDLSKHHLELGKQLNEIQDQRNFFQQNLIEFKNQPDKLHLIEQINRWETNAIKKIQQTAQQQRDIIFKYINEIESKLADLTIQLRKISDENDFNEIILNQLRNQFQLLENEFQRPSTLTIREESNLFINKLIVVQKKLLINPKWKQHGSILIDNDQLSRPTGLFIDHNQIIYIADSNSNRIIQFNGKEHLIIEGKDKQFIFPTKIIYDKQTDSMFICDHGNRRVIRWSNQNQQIIISNIDCFDLVMDKQGYLYVSDIRKHEVQRWKIGETCPTIVAGGNGQGNRLDQLNRPFYIFVDDQQSIYVSDCDNHRIVKWIKDAKEGIIIAGGHASGNGLHQLSFPNGIFVDQFETLFIADRNNHRILRWTQNSQQGSIILGGNGQGNQTNQLNRPSDLSFDQNNNLYILDCINSRLLKFHID